jgi:maltooligosyltrehalose trehalohydrolase
VIAESDANDPRLLRSPERDGLGMDAVWNDDFHHAVHAALTGERAGYYADYGTTAALAKSFDDVFVFDGAYSAHRERRHGAAATGLARDRFVVFVQNHDQIGNRAQGERLEALLPPAACRLATSLLLLSPGLPLLFMGEEYGEPAPFLYFVDHEDAALREAVRVGRRREFAAFGFADEVPDPAEIETFVRSRLDASLVREPTHASRRQLYKRLLALRRAEPALRADTMRPRTRHDESARWLCVEYAADAARPLFAAFQLGPVPSPLKAPGGADWELLFASEDAAFGGPGSAAPSRLGAGETLTLDAFGALLYGAGGST